MLEFTLPNPHSPTLIMPLPIKIDPCPIVESILEIRFAANVPSEAIYGILYENFKDQFPRSTKLPIVQLPEAVLTNDPQLTFLPHYRLENPEYRIQFGPRVVSLIVNEPYPEWATFSSEIYKFVDTVHKSGLIKQIQRIGLRYLNFFEKSNIFENIKLQISLDSKKFLENRMHFISLIKEGEYFCNLKIQSDSNITHTKIQKEGADILIQKDGSLIDIDVYLDQNIEEDKFFKDPKSIIDKNHDIEKNLFFTLLDDEILKTFNPKYK